MLIELLIEKLSKREMRLVYNFTVSTSPFTYGEKKTKLVFNE